MPTKDEIKMEILLKMEDSVLEATTTARYYDLAFDIKSSVIYVMNLYKEFHGKPHSSAHLYNL